jgi:hypothetical protein
MVRLIALAAALAVLSACNSKTSPAASAAAPSATASTLPRPAVPGGKAALLAEQSGTTLLPLPGSIFWSPSSETATLTYSARNTVSAKVVLQQASPIGIDFTAYEGSAVNSLSLNTPAACDDGYGGLDEKCYVQLALLPADSPQLLVAVGDGKANLGVGVWQYQSVLSPDSGHWQLIGTLAGKKQLLVAGTTLRLADSSQTYTLKQGKLFDSVGHAMLVQADTSAAATTNVFSFPAPGGTVQLTCTGTLTLGGNAGTAHPADNMIYKDARAYVFLDNRRSSKGANTGAPAIQMGGPNNAELLATVNSDPPRGERAETRIDAQSWDIANSYIVRDEHSIDTRISVESQTGHVESRSTFANGNSHAYSGECQVESEKEIAARRTVRELSDNPRLASVMRITFLPTPACQAYRGQLLRIANQPFISEIEWNRAFESATGAAQRNGCFLPQ